MEASRCLKGSRRPMYVCNCNGIRERDARAAIDAGAKRPADVFRRCQATPRCVKCVDEIRRMIALSEQSLRLAAE
jgi:bacterioferritin-associated ferredoxin